MLFSRLKNMLRLTGFAAALAAGLSAAGAQGPGIQIDGFGDGFIVALGGKLYDNLWAVIDLPPPPERHPRFPKSVDLPAKQTWRCVSCHGWDYRGNDGERARLGKDPAFRSLRHLAGVDPSVIVKKIRGLSHGYPEKVLPDYVLEILARFISAGQYDRDALLNDAGIAVGNLSRGRDIFEGVCMNCHQPDGRAPLEGETDDRSSLGWIARNRPEQALHKIRNGVPNADMLALRFLDREQIRDLFSYLQTLDLGDE